MALHDPASGCPCRLERPCTYCSNTPRCFLHPRLYPCCSFQPGWKAFSPFLLPVSKCQSPFLLSGREVSSFSKPSLTELVRLSVFFLSHCTLFNFNQSNNKNMFYLSVFSSVISFHHNILSTYRYSQNIDEWPSNKNLIYSSFWVAPSRGVEIIPLFPVIDYHLISTHTTKKCCIHLSINVMTAPRCCCYSPSAQKGTTDTSARPNWIPPRKHGDVY